MSGCFDAQMIICALTGLTTKEQAAQKEFRLRRVVKSHGRVMEASQAMAGKSADFPAIAGKSADFPAMAGTSIDLAPNIAGKSADLPAVAPHPSSAAQ